MGFVNSRDAISNHVFAEDKGVDSIDTLGGKQTMTQILDEDDRIKHPITDNLNRVQETWGY